MPLFLVELALLILTLLFIAYPLYKRELDVFFDHSLTESDYSDLLYRKEAAYTSLIDLEFDYKTGKIDDNDYKTMKTGMESEAIDLLKRVDDYEKEGSSRTAPEEDKKHFCHNCGSKVAKDQRFCSECGTRL